MEIRVLKYFLTVAREEGISRAAEVLHLTQPTLSRQLANAYPEARLVLIHWGTVDAPEFTPFNADPQNLYDRVVNPDRICPLWPGEALTL